MVGSEEGVVLPALLQRMPFTCGGTRPNDEQMLSAGLHRGDRQLEGSMGT